VARTIGEILRERRERLNMKQSELAKAAHVPQGRISTIEGGTERPSFEVIARLAAALDLSLDVIAVEMGWRRARRTRGTEIVRRLEKLERAADEHVSELHDARVSLEQFLIERD
jgi:transcriptional regulator with XRE-family HTH domain